MNTQKQDSRIMRLRASPSSTWCEVSLTKETITEDGNAYIVHFSNGDMALISFGNVLALGFPSEDKLWMAKDTTSLYGVDHCINFAGLDGKDELEEWIKEGHIDTKWPVVLNRKFHYMLFTEFTGREVKL